MSTWPLWVAGYLLIGYCFSAWLWQREETAAGKRIALDALGELGWSRSVSSQLLIMSAAIAWPYTLVTSLWITVRILHRRWFGHDE